MELKPGYKQTEVGVIPEDWEVKSLGQIMEYIKGFPFKADDYQSHGIRVLRVSDTTYDGIREGGGIYIDEKKAKSCLKWSLKEGDLIVSTVGSKPPMYSSMVGKVTFIQARDSGSLLNQNAVILRGRSSSIAIQRVLHNHFRQGRYLKYIEKIFRGNANQASITLRELFEYRIPFTPFGAEQEAIAEALSDADALIESLEQLIAKKRQIKQGAMQELLTGKKRLPGFSGEWEVKSLGEIASAIKGSQLHSGEVIQDGRYVYLNGGISPSGYIEKANTPANTIAVSEGGNSCGYVQFMEEPYWCGGHCYSIVQQYVDNRFLFQALKAQQSFIMGLRVGSGLPNVQKSALLSFKVCYPTDREEQIAIANILSDMDVEIKALDAKLIKAWQIKQGMMQNLLTGKIRLV